MSNNYLLFVRIFYLLCLQICQTHWWYKMKHPSCPKTLFTLCDFGLHCNAIHCNWLESKLSRIQFRPVGRPTWMRQDGVEWKQRFFPNTSLGLPSLICVDMGMISYAMGLYGLASLSLLVYYILTRPGANCPLPLKYWFGYKTASLSPQRFRNWVKCKFWFQPTLHFLFLFHLVLKGFYKISHLKASLRNNCF